jgi:cytoskeletal protein CcmA (bactofilin family)
MIRGNRLLSPLVSTILITILYSCGGGGSQVADGGIGGTGVTQGRVTGFGSIFVNGIEYDTDNASFTVNNTEGSQGDLAIGMVVRINGRSDQSSATGEAESVEYDSLIEGIIDSNDIATNNTLTIMGQVILVDRDTVYENPFDATLLEALPVNSVAEVSGFTDGNGDILATRIEVQSLSWAGDNLEVSGIVSNISGTRFRIGELMIEASDALPIPAEGTFAEVEGDSFSGDLFVADSIDVKGDGTTQIAEDGEEVEIEGRITTALNEQDQLSLNGQLVDASATQYSGATNLLTLGRIAEVEGVMNGAILIAEEIELKAGESEKGELAGILGSDSVDTTAGTIVLLGQIIQVNNSTIMESDLDDESSFNLSQLQTNDYLEAKVYSENGTLTATKLEREEALGSHTGEVEGIPEFIDDNTIRIFGVVIDTSATEYTFSTELVEIKGDFSNDILVARSIEVED